MQSRVGTARWWARAVRRAEEDLRLAREMRTATAAEDDNNDEEEDHPNTSDDEFRGEPRDDDATVRQLPNWHHHKGRGKGGAS